MKWNNKSHEFDSIGRFLASVKHVYFYGIGGHLKEIWECIECGREWFSDISFSFVDRNENLQSVGFCGQRIISPRELYEALDEENDKYLVVACPLGKTGDEIRDLLIANGVKEDKIAMGFDFLFTLIPIYFLYKYDKVFFTSQNIVPSSACNLNCRECLNFNPYIKKPVVYSLENVKKDIDVFFNAVDLIWRFQVTGGEPLLYPYFKEVLEYIDDNYRDRIFRLETVTNGTIIPNDEICEFLAKRKIFVFLDDYTLSLQNEHKKIRKDIERKFESFGVRYLNNYVDRWFKIYPGTKKQSEEELMDFFNSCANPYSTIENGKISACNYMLYAEKAGLLEGCKDDYYDLTDYDVSKKKELIEFRLRHNNKGYTSFCNQCAGYYLINENWYYPAIQVEKR